MSLLPRSVRARIAWSIALLVGVVAAAAAISVPKIVRAEMVDHLLDAQGSSATSAYPAELLVMLDLADESLVEQLVVPGISGTVSAIADTDALDSMRAFRGDGLIVVRITDRTVGVVGADDTVVLRRVSGPVEGPMITTGQLEQLALDLDRSWFDTQTLEELFPTGPRVLGAEPSNGGLPQRSPLTPVAPAPDIVYGVREVEGTDLIVAAPVASVERSVDQLTAVLWWIVPVAVVVAGLLAWWLAGRALRPVRMITERTSTIRGGTLHERVPVPPTDDEVAALATEMNEMLDRLQRDDSRRRQFVSDASHELRSPISAIRIQAEVALVEHDTGPTADLAAGVLAEADRMAVLVTDLLSLARQDEAPAAAGTVVDLDDLVLVEARRPRRVPVDTSAVSAGRVVGRPDELARVLAHLLDNAARHAATKAAAALATSGGTVTLTVDDDGPGVPGDERERIFERFVRLDEARRRDDGGAGLGLAVVAAVVHAAGGTVSATDSPLGGARFQVTLPAAP